MSAGVADAEARAGRCVVSGEAGGGYCYPDDEDEAGGSGRITGPVLLKHADHDPALICRPAFGYGLCELAPFTEDEG